MRLVPGLQEKFYKIQHIMSSLSEQIPMRDFPKLKGEIYEIPSQQRGYKWTPANIKELLRDLWSS